ncbi:MAG TPA: EAL domain-containing protein [Noviherbaspirillum sp.]|jgi:EAL domain-containing protein (putative c-di-GMP-specific phosphodiesterase class I)|uniref:EAL domain-containing protein n=1 Tax=Noviherbaspirillum sp. TaxID=1926288 RepID=UPI002DDD1792|nr:EAL domain-containing protein [Noviherbaspirillum sp.]HEV2612078.1 EAL domain-containing protein [Noviherbaspirillum sp.]
MHPYGASLRQLRNFPIHMLKIDRFFIRKLECKAEDQAIVEAIVAMGKTLHLTFVAEGLETTRQQEVQGYDISRSISAETFALFLQPKCNPPDLANDAGISLTAG